jgi:phage-related protein
LAIKGGDGSIILTTKVDETGLKKGLGSMKKIGATAGKAFLAIGAAAATATVAITKMATSAYADYEQLVGGVETLFKGSADKVKAYAENAFYTAGVSANEYMKQVTSFSASLIRSTAGDTDKAADIANMALIDISDNVNKMGSSMESVTLAYQGFAKQQYMLLDNLKLGYGGTKTEMERLLRDAEALTGVKYDINNLADVYSAIHAIQEELGITGTTAKEAEKTITGSANMMKAAWQNVLSAIAGGGDLDKAINNLVYSVQKYFENIVPVVERSLQGIGQLIERVAPLLVQTVARALIKAIPSLLNAVYQMIIGLAKGIYQGIIDLFRGGAQKVLEAQTNEIAQSVKNQNALTEAVEETNKALEGSTASFDEVNTLTKNSAQNQELLSQTGGIGGVGAEIENETSGFTAIMQEQFAKIAEIAKMVWDSTPIQAFVNTAKKYLDSLLKFYKKIGNSIWKNTKELYFFVEKDLKKAVGVYSKIWEDYWILLGEKIDEWSPVITQKVDDFIETLTELFKSIETNIIDAIITPMFETISWLWEKQISPLADKIADFVGTLVEDALIIYNKVIAPIVMWVQEKLAPAWAFVSQLIIGSFGSVVAFISDGLGRFIGTLTGLLDFITGVFTGDWKKAWNGVKTIFKSVFDGLVGIVKYPLNLIIDAINALIAGLNKIKLPNWGIFGNYANKSVNIPKIPKLATGAVIPPNREFLAVLGDQKHGTNIEAPLDTIKQAVAEVLAQVSVGSNGYNGRIEVPVIINGREVARAVREAESNMGSQTVFGGFANVY